MSDIDTAADIAGRTVHMSLDDVIPYWRNPRRISAEAVEAVAESLRQYGYQQPIVVDPEHVIIIGHTRYAAMRKMGIEAADILVAEGLSPHETKQLRIIDNRSGEYTGWNYEQLRVELSEQDLEAIVKFFPELRPAEDEPLEGFMYNDPDEDDEPEPDDQVSFVCPTCFHGWEQKVTPGMVMSGLIKAD